MGDDATLQGLASEPGPWVRRRRLPWAAYTVFALLAVALALGVFGGGPLSQTSVREGEASLTYQRFARHGGPWTMTVEAPPVEGKLSVSVSRSFHQAQQVQAIAPEPSTVVVSDTAVRYDFDARSDGGDVQVDFHLDGAAMGLHRGTVTVGGADPINLWQFLYP